MYVNVTISINDNVYILIQAQRISTLHLAIRITVAPREGIVPEAHFGTHIPMV